MSHTSSCCLLSLCFQLPLWGGWSHDLYLSVESELRAARPHGRSSSQGPNTRRATDTITRPEEKLIHSFKMNLQLFKCDVSVNPCLWIRLSSSCLCFHLESQRFFQFHSSFLSVHFVTEELEERFRTLKYLFRHLIPKTSCYSLTSWTELTLIFHLEITFLIIYSFSFTLIIYFSVRKLKSNHWNAKMLLVVDFI